MMRIRNGRDGPRDIGGAVIAAAALGAATGLRSMSGIAFLCGRLAREDAGPARRLVRALAAGRTGTDPVRRLLSSTGAGRVVPAFAAGELIADKLPGIPARIAPGPLVARALLGALCGWLVSDRRGQRVAAIGAVVGGVAAVASAHTGYRLRRRLSHEDRLPDFVVAIAEDAAAIGLSGVASRSIG